MSETKGGLVCGFADEAAAVVGLAWSLAGDGGGMIVGEGETVAAGAAIEPEGDGLRLGLDGEGISCEATLTPSPGVVPLPAAEVEAGLPEPSAAICAVRASLRDGGERRLDCRGHLTRWGADPTEGAELLRHLAVPGPDRSLLILTAVRAAGAANHGDEGIAAWQLDPEGGALPFGEALLSTQYDREGMPVRAGLELWRAGEESPPVRAAGTLERGTALRRGPVTIAALHTSAEGTPGIGSYLLWRR